MTNVNRWGLAAGVVAALALSGGARAQSATGGSTSSGSGQSGAPRGEVGVGASGTGAASGAGTATEGGTGTGSTGAGTQKLDKKWQARLEKLHAANQAEVHMGTLGAQSATSPEVKEYAQRIQTDHQQMDQELTQAAQSAGATSLEGKDFDKAHQDAMKDMKKLEGKSGNDFDREFMSRMVKDHEKDLKEVKSAARDAQKSHPELASALQAAQGKIQGHLDEARQLEKSLKAGARASGASGAPSSGTGSAAGTGSGAEPRPGKSAESGRSAEPSTQPGAASPDTSNQGKGSRESTQGGAAGTVGEQGSGSAK